MVRPICRSESSTIDEIRSNVSANGRARSRIAELTEQVADGRWRSDRSSTSSSLRKTGFRRKNCSAIARSAGARGVAPGHLKSAIPVPTDPARRIFRAGYVVAAVALAFDRKAQAHR